MLPTKEYLLTIFDYNPETGILMRIRATNKHLRFIGKTPQSTDKDGYLLTTVEGKTCKVHRIIYKMVYGEEPPMLDHINRDKRDNRIINLRPVTTKQNLRNRCNNRKIRDTDYSVVYHKLTGKFCLMLSRKHLGLFDSLEIAETIASYNPRHASDIIKHLSCNEGIHWHTFNKYYQITIPLRFRLGKKSYLGSSPQIEVAKSMLDNYIKENFNDQCFISVYNYFVRVEKHDV